MRILVTGGAGFIGSHIAENMVQENHDVSIVDNFSTGRLENIKDFKDEVSLYNLDVGNKGLDSIFNIQKPEIVIHCAAQTSLRNSIKNPEFDCQQNVLNTINLLTLCKRYNVERFIYFSTGGAIYNPYGQIPWSESSEIGPMSPYGVSKYCAEQYINHYMKPYNTVIFRPSNVYGPRQNPLGEAGVISIFAELIKNDDPCIVYGTGQQTRDFIYISDVVQAVRMAVVQNRMTGIFNVSSRSKTSVLDILKKLYEIYNKTEKVTFQGEVSGEMKDSMLDNHKLQSYGWNQAINLDEGLRKVVTYAQNGDIS